MFLLLAIVLLAHGAQAGAYVLEGGSLEMIEDKGTSDAMTIEAGTVPSQSESFQLVPLIESGLCGDGVRQGGEACDGADIGTTCQLQGFAGGSLLCSPSCALITTGCSTHTAGGSVESAEESGGSAGGAGGASGGGGGGGTRRLQPVRLMQATDTAPSKRPDRAAPALPGRRAFPAAVTPTQTSPTLPSPSLTQPSTTAPSLTGRRTPSLSPLQEVVATQEIETPVRDADSCPLCIFNVAEAGIFTRLAMLYRFESVMAVIPAYQIEAAAVSPLLGMRVGAIRLDALLAPLFFLRRRRKEKRGQSRKRA